MARDKFDWLEKLDINRALANCRLDIYRDWYRDPWGWPELDWSVDNNEELILQRLNAEGVRRAAKLDVAKENFSVRPAIVMDPIDRLVYQALVDAISVSLIGGLRTWVYGVRLEIKNPQPGTYGRLDNQWKYYRGHLKMLALQSAALKTDVVSFFASIPIDRVVEQVTARAGDTPVVHRLADLLDGWNRMPGRKGLPQRYIPSSVLATMYLAPVDDVLEEYQARKSTRKSWLPPRAARWMDDIWLFGRDPGRLRRAQLDIDTAMRDLDLSMALAKTGVLEGEEVSIGVQQREHSAVDAGLNEPQPSRDAFDELVNRLLEKPELADRTSVRFATHRMRRFKLFDRVDEFVEAAERMPHASDGLARLFRDSGKWRELGDWYVAYADSSWAAIDWSIAQFGTMFPSKRKVPAPVSDYLADATISTPSLAVLALGSQRLAAWDKERARVIIREASKRSNHPLERRILALAALAAGEERGFVKSVLSEFEENRVTLQMLTARKFRKVKLRDDFEGD